MKAWISRSHPAARTWATGGNDNRHSVFPHSGVSFDSALLSHRELPNIALTDLEDETTEEFVENYLRFHGAGRA